MNKYLRLLSFCTLILIISSCGRKTFFNFKLTNKEKVEVEDLDYKYLSLKSKVRFHNGEKQIGSSANIRIKKDEKIWISITPFVGIEAVRILFTPDSLVYLNKIEKEYQVYDYKALSKKYNVEINYNTIESFLVGKMPYERTSKDKILREEDKFEILQKRKGLNITNEIDPSFLKLRKLLLKEGKSNSFLSVSYDEFKTIDKGGKKKQRNFFPFQSVIDLVYFRENNVVSGQLNFNHQRVNLEENLRFPFKISKKYVRKK